MKLLLVNSRLGNQFMREILEGIAFEARAAGADAEVVDDVFPDDDDAVFVVIPHEYFGLAPRSDWPTESQLSRTFALTVEHPGTQWFEISALQAQRCAAIIDINRDSTAELRRRSQPATLFQLGYSEYYDVWHGADNERSTDIVYLGSTDAKRDRALAGSAPFWWDRDVNLLIPGHQPKTEESPDFIAGRRKLELLRDSKIIVNLHRDKSRSMEWVRVLEAIANGTVVFSEHSVDAAPLVAQQHFISASPESLGLMAANALDNAEYLDGIRHRAYDFVREHLRLSSAVEILLEAAEKLLDHPLPVRAGSEIAQPEAPADPPPAWVEFQTHRDHTGEALARLETKTARLLRALDLTRSELAVMRGDTPRPPVETPAFAATKPVVSVIMPSYNVGRWIEDALDSVLASRGVDYEILIHNDASTDDTVDVVERYIRSHPHAPIKLSHAVSNLGLAATRNALLQGARGEYVFPLDPDNGVYPTALAQLVEKLRDDDEAAFAYSIIATFNGGKPQNLISNRPWDPSLFRFGNYIDSMALIRADRLHEVGGWDPAIPNWEDFHLWVRFAERGWHAAFIPAMLSWYRVFPFSMSQESTIHRPQLWTILRSAAPTVLADRPARVTRR